MRSQLQSEENKKREILEDFESREKQKDLLAIAKMEEASKEHEGIQQELKNVAKQGEEVVLALVKRFVKLMQPTYIPLIFIFLQPRKQQTSSRKV